jgi:hypothetical protein
MPVAKREEQSGYCASLIDLVQGDNPAQLPQ